MEIRKNLSPDKSDLDLLNSNFQDYVASIYPQLPDESEDRPIGTILYHMKKRLDGR